MADEQFSSDNFYEILGVEPNSSQNEIKRGYQILALKYHPDKYDPENLTCSREEAKGYFHLIDKAWKTLSDSKTKNEYDATLREQQLNQDWPVDAEIKLSEMEFDEEYKHYTLSCRCSGSYEVTEENLANGENIISCTTCSLTIRILYCPQENENK